ncbi:MAG TPA: DUF4303 domain-containing protein [Polyangiaceae bacterium]|jgi:hypothetical protein|nr:DUF4303 domain-containing protein [Polyangiaceae bacterium]
MSVIDRNLFRDTLLAELRSAWQSLRAARPAERFYSFGLYTTELAEYLMVTASTEEGLTVATEKYLARNSRDPNLTRASLRWSPCDSPIHEEASDLLPKSAALRAAGPNPYDETQESVDTVSFLFDVAVDVLKQLDRERLFGTGLERARLVLGIWKGDQSDEEHLEFARRLNPKSVLERFAQELDAGNEAFVELSRARRG